MTVNKITNAPSQKTLIDKVNEVIDNLGSGGGGTVDQTYNSTSTNAQSGVAINGELTTNYQTKLVSGTNIKTINGNSIVGSGNIETPYRNIGEIVQSTIPLTDSGLHLLDGSLISGSGSYSAFVEYIADLYDSGNYSDIFETEANWQSSVTTYGVCGKFVYDSTNNTVRLPKITGFTESTTDPTVLGDLTQAGLPNITGTNLTWHQVTDYITGCFNVISSFGSGMSVSSSGAQKGRVYEFDASRSSSIYGNASTVQPQSIKVLYYIVTANSTKTSIQVDIDEIATDLNGKADVDLTNINNTGTSKVAGWAMPSTTYSDFTIGASGASYIIPANGWLTCIGLASAAGQYLNVINADPITSATIADCRRATGSSQYIASSIPVVKGDIIIVGYTLGTMNAIRFVYAKGSESEAS